MENSKKNWSILALPRLFLILVMALFFATTTEAIAAESRTITGMVFSASGETLPGVSVTLRGTTRGVITDSNGGFSLEVFPADRELRFSFIGMRSQTVLIDDRTIYEIFLEEDAIGLDEFIVVGYMTQRKADLTGSIAIVSQDDLSRSRSANVMKTLQGKVPGVYIRTDGNPVDNVSIQIRGITSVNAAPPLLVIDGLPTNVNLRNINPEDIESMQVLRDAASASIYGSRAASGVILITTKQARAGELQVNYTGRSGVSALLNPPRLLNSDQYASVLWQAAVNDGVDPNTLTQIYHYDWHIDPTGRPILNKATPVEWLNLEQTQRSADTDWFKEGTQIGQQQNHTVTAQSGTQTARNLFSMNYYENNGTQIHTYFKRYSFRLNSSYDLMDGRLRLGENLSLSSANFRNENQMHRLVVIPPIVPVRTIDGKDWGGSAMALGMDDFWNPVRLLTMEKGNTNNELIGLGNIFAELELLDGLRIRSQFGLEHRSHFYRHINFSYREAGGLTSIASGVSNYQSNTTSWTFTNTAQYSLLRGDHSLEILGGIEAYRFYFESLAGNRDNIELQNYNYAYLDAATGGLINARGIGDENTLLSYFSKVNYSLQNKYLLSATLRYDGSSKFPENNKFGFFPAFSAGWRITQEDFMSNLPFVSHLQLRASWGRTGNQNIPSDAINTSFRADYDQTSYDIEGRKFGNLPSGYRMMRQGNPNLRWEATEQTNLGFDFSLFNYRLSGSFDYFLKGTDGMLFSPNYLGTIGEGGFTWINAANMTNKGVEVTMTYSSDTQRDLTFNITGNVAAYRNRIDDLPEAVKFQYGGNGLDDNILGLPLNSFYGFVVEGIFQNQQEVDESPDQPGKGVGRLRFKDLNGDGRITWEHDRTWIGVDEPDFLYGVDFLLKYKNFDFNMFWQGITGIDIYNNRKLYSDWYSIGIFPGMNKSTRILNAWTPYNTDTDVPALSLTNSNAEERMSTHFIEPGAYLKLRNIELGYTFTGNTLQRINAANMRVFVSANNVVSIAKRWGDNPFTAVDPENSHSEYQQPRLFFFGVSATF